MKSEIEKLSPPFVNLTIYALAMTINHCYWERDYKRHCVRQAEKEALKSHFWKQGKLPPPVLSWPPRTRQICL